MNLTLDTKIVPEISVYLKQRLREVGVEKERDRVIQDQYD